MTRSGIGALRGNFQATSPKKGSNAPESFYDSFFERETEASTCDFAGSPTHSAHGCQSFR